MRNHFKFYTKLIVCTLVAALMVSGFSSISHASTIDAPIEVGNDSSSPEKVATEYMDKSGSHSHHSNSGHLCHSVTCNLYVTSQIDEFGSSIYEKDSLAASTEQRVQTFLATLYRPPKVRSLN